MLHHYYCAICMYSAWVVLKATIMTTKKSFLTEIIFSNNEQEIMISHEEAALL